MTLREALARYTAALVNRNDSEEIAAAEAALAEVLDPTPAPAAPETPQ